MMLDQHNTYYDVLQVGHAAEPEVIRAAYRSLAQKYHPDVNNSPDAVKRMQDLNEAFRVLNDPITRREYDAKLGVVASPKSTLAQRTHHLVTIVGLLQSDPELRYRPDATPVVSLRVRAAAPAGAIDAMAFFYVSVDKDLAEYAMQNLCKASLVYIEGQLVCDPQTGGPWTTAMELSCYVMRAYTLFVLR